MDPAKIQTIQDWPEPRKVNDIQKFLGFANFYRRFIDNDKCRNAFNTLKSAFLSAPILTHWIPDRQITLETDASDYAIGAILSITLPNGEIHPVAYHSRTLTEPELNYDTH